MTHPSPNYTNNSAVFFRIIVKCILQHNKMNLPLKFVGRYGHELGHEARLIVPNGRVWKIELGRENNEIYLGAGLENFFQCYSICYRCLLIMKYKGSSNFDVQILDTTHSEIQYPQFAKSDKFGTVRVDEQVEKEVEIFASQKIRATLSKMSEKTRKLFQDAKISKPKKPSFLVIIMDSIIQTGVMHVPSGFAKMFINPDFTEIKIEIRADGKKWMMNNTCRWNRGSFRLQKGWPQFYEDCCLKHGDVCLFELLQKDHIVFKVSIFRV